MFDEPLSLPMRAAMASLLGGLFGIGMILYTHSAHAQSAEAAAPAAVDAVAVIKRLGDATLHSLRGGEAVLAGGVPGMRGLRINDSGVEPGAGLRWQMAPRRVLHSEVENPRGGDQLSVGVQLRF